MAVSVRICLYLATTVVALSSFSAGGMDPRLQTEDIPPIRAVTQAEYEQGRATSATLLKRFSEERNAGLQLFVQYTTARLLEAAAKQEIGLEKPETKWNIVLLRSNRVNASAAVGHWIFVHTGLLKFIRSEQELAAVLAHEIGHALADHPTELSFRDDRDLRGADVPTNFLIKAFERFYVEPKRHQMEFRADAIGILLMADAGYDPRGAISFFTRFAEVASRQESSPEALRTHPVAAERLSQLEKLLPEATARYEATVRKGRPSFGLFLADFRKKLEGECARPTAALKRYCSELLRG